MENTSYTSNEPLANARTVLTLLRDILANPRAVTYITHRGICEPAELGKAACSVGILVTNSHATDFQNALRSQIEPIADTLRFLKARFTLQQEPSMFGASSAAEKIEAEKMIRAIDQIAAATGLTISPSQDNSPLGLNHTAAFRDR